MPVRSAVENGGRGREGGIVFTQTLYCHAVLLAFVFHDGPKLDDHFLIDGLGAGKAYTTLFLTFTKRMACLAIRSMFNIDTGFEIRIPPCARLCYVLTIWPPFGCSIWPVI